MGKNLILAAKFLTIALFAALAAWSFMALWMLIDSLNSTSDIRQTIIATFHIALLGSYAVGLPVAVLVFAMSKKHLIQSPTTLFMIATLSGIMMALASLVIGDAGAALLFGMPSFIAAMTYAVLGWFWILKPLRKTSHV